MKSLPFDTVTDKFEQLFALVGLSYYDNNAYSYIVRSLTGGQPYYCSIDMDSYESVEFKEEYVEVIVFSWSIFYTQFPTDDTAFSSFDDANAFFRRCVDVNLRALKSASGKSVHEFLYMNSFHEFNAKFVSLMKPFEFIKAHIEDDYQIWGLSANQRYSIEDKLEAFLNRMANFLT